jgi:hypothetical protein
MADSGIEPGNTDQPACWSIDLSWFAQHNRSFATLARDSLCKDCRKELSGGKERSDSALLQKISKCCSNGLDFISAQQPLMESVFRAFLASGNQPLTLEQLGQLLSERRGGSRTPEATLLRMLQTDRYYGLRPVPVSILS